MDNIPSEPLKNGGEATTTVLLVRRLVISLLKKGDLKQCQKYRTINLISHPSKIMLRIILNRLQAKAEELLAEEQAGVRSGRSTVEQIFSNRVIIEKYLQHQRVLFHKFIDFKKASDRAKKAMQACGRSPDASTQRKDWFKPFRHYLRTPAVQSSGTIS